MKHVLCIFCAALFLGVAALASDNPDYYEFDDIPSSSEEGLLDGPESVPESELEVPASDPDLDETVFDTTFDDDAGLLELEELEEPVAEDPIYDESNPLPVVVLEPESTYAAVRSGTYSLDMVIGDEPPSDPPFYGAGFITGTSDTLGTVTLYFPINYDTGSFGVDANGYLFNVTSSSLSGYLEGVYNNSVSAPAFSYPRYREGSGYDYTTLYITPTDSNMKIATSNAPKYSVTELIPYVMIVLLGGVFLCCMKRS